jgi:Mycothiol maleylpyruvate isomerase N-terminal domain
MADEPLFDAIERKQLADLFYELGPDAPTLLDPWTTRDLAAHLVLRQQNYLAAPGLVLPGAWAAKPRRRMQKPGSHVCPNQCAGTDVCISTT